MGKMGYIAVMIVWVISQLTMTNKPLAVAPIKTTWIWDATTLCAPKDFFSFALQKKIKEVYVQIDTTVATTCYSTFIQQAHQDGIRVFALDGNPKWGLKANVSQPLELVKWVAHYNQTASHHEFDGLQVDIEPYTLSQWKTNRTTVVKEWMDVANTIVTEAKKNGILVSAVIPFWLDTVPLQDPVTYPTAKTLSEWMIRRFDHIAVMAYRNKAEGHDGIISVAKSTIKTANINQTPVILAVETMQSKEGEKVTFYGKSEQDMDTELIKVNQYFSKYTYFKGNGIHYYESYKELQS